MKTKVITKIIIGLALLLVPVFGLSILGCETDSPSSSVTNISISPLRASVKQGEAVQFSASVSAINGAHEGVLWSVEGGHPGTAIFQTGLLTLATDESAETLTVRVISTFDTAKSAVAIITVTPALGVPSVSGVTITPNTVTVEQGETQQFTAHVDVTGDLATTKTWSVTGNTSDDTTISGDGLLTVAAGETAETLTVMAVSTADKTRYDAVSVTVTPAPVSHSIALNPVRVSVDPGKTQQFAAVDNEGQEIAVSWSVEGSSTGTEISQTGLLTVTNDETAVILTVKAVSTADTAKSATAIVTIIQPPQIHSVTVNPSTVSVHKGSTQRFTANVSVTGDAVRTVIWSVDGAAAAETTISAEGLLSVGAGETAATLTVKAVSTADSGKFNTSTVSVAVPMVQSVALSPATASMQRGTTLKFIVMVKATGDLAKTVTWSVDGAHTGTAISTDGLLTVATTETSGSLTVTAISTADTSKFGTATITVTTPSGPTPSTWTAITITGFAGLENDSINSVSYGAGTGFIAGGGPYAQGAAAHPVISISSNGIDNWSPMDLLIDPFDSYVGKIVYLNDKFLVTRGSGVKVGLYSTDSENWAVTEIGFGTKGFAYGNGTYVVGGQHGQAAWSSNGTDWNVLTLDKTTFDNGSANQLYINAVAYGNSIFVMGGGRGHTAWSGDGKNWQGVQGNTAPSEIIFDGPSGFIDCMVFGAGKFVALGGMDGYDAKSAWSIDGVHWTQGGDPHLKTGNGSPTIEFGGGFFLAGDNNGNASYSKDGISWTAIGDTTFAGTPIKGVAYGDSRFVMVGGEGKAAYSLIE
ncbi:Ig domain protein, group 2 domain protein [Treponema primitia ZAS-2]|uniref:Ig domain protein, group 2 domain protein n=1 Tax=Treponema primitia (strain ATCC BAA-887 / DSM 12427 / ZAS-2) TaxID=545694 RepID=F5YH70_TREPZ|nr:Ig-like domain-containing protein [Treponema primitia]AEF86739.1 Ig domain protein, group 2 domain protein [Treponema primitia ZAS-2]